ncbi:serine/threonine-protein kinase [Nocardioides sp. Soil796]|uniref:serine/threonine-protein kinase n=1 Tax=Nocardioides sp. Soil796 TaxID=1736412 RepID=UPI00070B0DD2|nr:serine/threonine-protein kinase [Nocardioides sp. Soil796]KRF11701.1 hypothetical protein ASH02_17070 [Nocardioides sp. Soil796]
MFTSLRPGTLVGGRYRIEAVVGSGGMGVVHSARDEHLNRRVALKVMTGHLAEDPTFRERFVREAAVLGRLDSPHIVQVFDHGDMDGHLWIATQLVEGGDLARLVAERGPLSPRLARHICAQVADALQDAHARGVVHRDVKPENILLANPGAAEPHVFLTDFGLAREIGDDVTAVRSTAGTWDYLAPECGTGRPATAASDVYAVGCLLWTCLTGRPPYAGTMAQVALAHARNAPPTLVAGPSVTAADASELNTVITKAMSKDPQRRQASAGELAADVRGRVTGRAPGARRRRRSTLLAVAAVAATILGVGLALNLPDPGNPPPQADATPPTDEQSEAESANPVKVTGRPITGDQDDDGFGDVFMTSDDSVKSARLMVSDGKSLSSAETWARGADLLMQADVAGDRTSDLLSIVTTGFNDAFRVTVTHGGTKKVEKSVLRAPGEALDVKSALGDYDGDGRDDLAVVTQNVRSGERARIWVSRSTESGFGRLRTWREFEAEEVRPVPGDFDGDGDDDLALVAATSIKLLESDGSSFASVGVQEMPQELGPLAAGDFDGDGTDELVGDSQAGGAIIVWRHVRNQWNARVSSSDERDPGVHQNAAPAVADVNGDGRDDALFLAGELNDAPNLLVAVSKGSAFANRETWLHPAWDRDLAFVGRTGQ